MSAVVQKLDTLKKVNTAGAVSLNNSYAIRIDRLIPDPNQPRKIFNKVKLEELADSIQQEKQQTTINVRKGSVPGTFIIIAGERRWRAGKIIQERTGKDFSLQAIVEMNELSEMSIYKKSFIENTNRSEMTDLEVAAGLVKMHEAGTKKSELMTITSMKYSSIVNYMRMHTVLSDEVKDMMHPDIPKDQRLRTSHAINISRLKNHDTQLEIAIEVVERSLSVNDTMIVVKSKATQLGLKVDEKGSEKTTSTYHQSILFSNFLARVKKQSESYLMYTNFEKMYLGVMDDTKASQFHKKSIAATIHSLETIQRNIQYVIDQLKCMDTSIRGSRDWDKSEQ